jgi:restriction system protein
LLLGIFHQFWWQWLFLFSFSLLGALFKSPSFKGWLGEHRLNRQLQRLPREQYHLIANLTLPTVDGSTQIDHVLVSRYGIFVIETKNYSGWIFGKASDRVWTQQLYRRRHGFQNPLRQNYKHTRTLAELLEIDEQFLFSLIVFVGSAEFKTPMPSNVVQLGSCLNAIKAKTVFMLGEDEVARVITRIASKRLAPGLRTPRAHVRHVKESTGAGRQVRQPAGATAAIVPPASAPPTPAPEAAPAPAPACPLCQGELATLTYKTGPKLGQSFHGCTHFPACDYRADLAPSA